MDRDTQRGARSQQQQQQTEGRAGGPDRGRVDAAGRTQVRGTVDLSVEQRTRIRQTVLARSDVPRVRNVDFALSVGTAIPSHVEIVDVPPALIEIYPEWRGQQYFVVEDEIVIVSPSREIVAVVPVGASQARVGSASVLSLSEPEIREVQLVLIERGFLDGEADGIFGPQTRTALIEFQRSEGLQVSGSIDTRTVSAMNLSGKISVQGEERGRPSTVGRGSEDSRSSPRMDQRQPAGRQDMNEERSMQPRGQMSPQMRQDRSTTGQGGDQLRGDRIPQRGERSNAPSTTGQGGEGPARRTPNAPDTGSPSPSGSSSPSGGTGR